MEFYHLLNRGVDKRNIFLDKQDYYRFIHNLFEFNNQLPSYSNNYYFNQSSDIGCPKIEKDVTKKLGRKRQKQKRKLLVNIHFFCLMPNHYHLMVSPVVEDGIPRFMKKLNMGYAKYFNKKNDRVGALFQGKYKSVLVERDAYFLYLPYYIHLNPLDLKTPEWRENEIHNLKKSLEYLQSYRWSSHLDYTGVKNFPSVTQRKFFLEFFGGEKGYTKSIKKYLKDMNVDEMGGVILE